MTLPRICQTLPLLVMMFLLSVTGVYAAWLYCEVPLESVNVNVNFEMSIFQWQGSENLPDDEQAGQAHAVLIDKLINGDGVGLNSEDSYLNQQIQIRSTIYQRDTLGSMAVTQGNELTNLFDLETENVAFLIQTIEEETYYIFTTSEDLGENGSPNYAIGTTISPIFRTTVKLVNGSWTAVVTEEGSAPSAYYEESRWININRTKIPSFDPDKWSASS